MDKQFYANLLMTDEDRVVLWDEMNEMQQERALALFRWSLVPHEEWAYALTRDRCRIAGRQKLRGEDLNNADH